MGNIGVFLFRVDAARIWRTVQGVQHGKEGEGGREKNNVNCTW